MLVQQLPVAVGHVVVVTRIKKGGEIKGVAHLEGSGQEGKSPKGGRVL
jgi:hypothetical protein